MKVFVNGELKDRDSLAEIFEPGFLFGWGVFEPFRVYKGKIPFFNAHTQRLYRSLTLLGIEQTAVDWPAVVADLLSENKLEDAYVRITVYKKRKGTGAVAYADKFEYYTPKIYDKGFSAIISPYRREVNEINKKVKSLSYLQNRLSWFEAQKRKKDEALVLNSKGFLIGGSRSNIFLVKDGKIITPSHECGAFSGITREAVLQISKEFNIEVSEEEITPKALFTCSEVFITSALMEIMPLVECEGRKIGEGVPGEITLKILSRYRSVTQ